MTGRRFIVRWSARTLQREWREHLLIFVLITLGVLLSVAGTVAAFNLATPPESEFGTGRIAATASDPDRFEEMLVAARVPFGRVDRVTLPRTGTTEQVKARVLDVGSPVTDPLIDLIEGRWPASPTEIAITDRAFLDPPDIGSTIELAETSFVVVGIVENPTRLGDEFALAASIDELAGGGDVATEFLIDADPSALPSSEAGPNGISSTDGPSVRRDITIAVSVVSAFGMLEIALLVGASFAVLSRRRTRQFGLLAASGASPKVVRSAATATGLLIGTLGASIGAAVGLALARVVLPSMEVTVGHRIDFTVPWATVVPAILGGIAVAGLAARWPARRLSRQPVIDLLAARRPRPEPAGRIALVGVVLTAAGAVALIAGFTQLNTELAVLGVLVAPIGLLLTAPLGIGVLSRVVRRLPVIERLAGRSLGRFNRRSAAVVGAIALVLAVPMGISVVTTSIDARAADRGPNLEENWAIAWAPGVRADGPPQLPAEIDQTAITAGGDALRAAAPELHLHRIEMAVLVDGPQFISDFPDIGSQEAVGSIVAGEPLEEECTFCNIDSYGFGDGDGDWRVTPAWIASPPLLAELGLDDAWLIDRPALARSSTNAALSERGLVAAPGDVVVAPTWPDSTSIPDVVYSPDLVDGDYERMTIGWFLVANDVIDEETRDALRQAAPNVSLEFHEPPEPSSTLRRIGSLIGVLVALGLAASAISLMSTEVEDDMAMLRALGAPRSAARRFGAATGALIAVVGAVLGALIGYLPLLPMVTSRADDFPFVVPWSSLGLMLVALPVFAAGVGWVAGRGEGSAAPVSHLERG